MTINGQLVGLPGQNQLTSSTSAHLDQIKKKQGQNYVLVVRILDGFSSRATQRQDTHIHRQRNKHSHVTCPRCFSAEFISERFTTSGLIPDTFISSIPVAFHFQTKSLCQSTSTVSIKHMVITWTASLHVSQWGSVPFVMVLTRHYLSVVTLSFL